MFLVESQAGLHKDTVSVALWPSPDSVSNYSAAESTELIIEAGGADAQYWRDGSANLISKPSCGPDLAVSFAVTIRFLWLGAWYFRRMEKTFAHVI